MPFTTEYANTINPVSNIIRNIAQENLVPTAVWKQHINRLPMPTDTQTQEVIKKGDLKRSVVPENTAYAYNAGSEYLETSVLVNPIKSVVISRVTLEQDTFAKKARGNIGVEQGKALALGYEEDIASLAQAFTSVIAGSGGSGAAKLIDVYAAVTAVMMATNNLAGRGSKIVGVFSQKTIFDFGMAETLAGTSTIYGNQASSVINPLESLGKVNPNGFVCSVGNVDIYSTPVVDDDATSYKNLIFDPTRALIGMYSDVINMSDYELLYFRDQIASLIFSDVQIQWNEAGCRLDSAIIS